MDPEVFQTPSHTISGLVKLRAERAGRILEIQKQLDQDFTELSAIDSVLKVLAPDLKLETIKARRSQCQPRHRISHLLLTALRTSEAPLTARDVALKVMVARNQPETDKKVVNSTVQKVQTSLQNLRRKKVVEVIPGSRPLAWKIAA